MKLLQKKKLDQRMLLNSFIYILILIMLLLTFLGLTLTSIIAQKTLHHLVVQLRPKRFDGLIVARWMDPVGQ